MKFLKSLTLVRNLFRVFRKSEGHMSITDFPSALRIDGSAPAVSKTSNICIGRN